MALQNDNRNVLGRVGPAIKPRVFIAALFLGLFEYSLLCLLNFRYRRD